MRGPLRLSWGDASPTPGQGFLQALGRWGRWEPLQGGWVVQGNASVSGGLGWQGLPSTTGTSISYLLGMAQLDIGPVCCQPVLPSPESLCPTWKHMFHSHIRAFCKHYPVGSGALRRAGGTRNGSYHVDPSCRGTPMWKPTFAMQWGRAVQKP